MTKLRFNANLIFIDATRGFGVAESRFDANLIVYLQKGHTPGGCWMTKSGFDTNIVFIFKRAR